MARRDRRRHPRRIARLGVSIHPDEPGKTTLGRTLDIAAGGIRCLLCGDPPTVGDHVRMELAVPAGDGHWPYAGAVTGQGTILRCERVRENTRNEWDAAIRFDQPLQLQFA